MFNSLLKIILGLTFLLVLATIASSNSYAATLKIEPEIISAEAGQEFTVEVHLDTEGNSTDGADAIIRYNSEKLEAVEILPGTIYQNYPIKKIEEGKVSITGLASSTGSFFSGDDLFASVKFKALLGGEENVRIDFAADSTVESNVAEHGKGIDILTGVNDSVLYLSGETAVGGSLIDTATAGRALLVVFYIMITAVVGFLIYRWWLTRLRREEEVFRPEQVPMDKPPGT